MSRTVTGISLRDNRQGLEANKRQEFVSIHEEDSAQKPAAEKILHRCLLVEDNESLLEALVILMEASGYSCACCTTADEARELLKQDSDFGILISDNRTPGQWNGTDLAGWVAVEYPSIGVVLMSGADSGVQLGNFRWLSKPFQLTELIEVVAELTITTMR